MDKMWWVKVLYRSGAAYSIQLLTETHKTGSSVDFLLHYYKQGEEFLNKIVTGNKTLLVYVNAKTEYQLMEWRYTGSPKNSANFNRKFMKYDMTINFQVYCETSLKLWQTIQNNFRCHVFTWQCSPSPQEGQSTFAAV